MNQMIVTGAFIAEHASVVDSKLTVRGGVLDYWTVDESMVRSAGA